MSARDVIARALHDQIDLRFGAVPWEDDCARVAIEALTAAGYTIIRDDENHKATVERCAQIADEIEQPGIPGTSQWLALGNFAGQIRDEIRSLIKEDGADE